MWDQELYARIPGSKRRGEEKAVSSISTTRTITETAETTMVMTEGYRLANPPHPGGFVRTEIIEPLRLSVTAASAVLGVTRTALSTFLNEHSALSPEMALRIEKAFGVPMETLMRMQNSYDIAQARRKEGEIDVARYTGNPALEPMRG